MLSLNTKKQNQPHPDLFIAQELAYAPSGFTYHNLKKEAESKDYGASTFEIASKQALFRSGKITPTKVGQFVTLWKRGANGKTQAYDLSDPVDLFIVSVRDKQNFGQFIFSKLILFEKGFISNKGKGGKRAMRIYPPWDKPDSFQAKKTQSWQLPYFLEIDPSKSTDLNRVQKLFNTGTVEAIE